MTLHSLSRQQVRRIDQRAIDEYGMIGLVLMENAGRGSADVLCELGISGPVVICCGRGNNAGDGFVMARHFAFRRVDVKLLLWVEPEKLRGDAAHNYQILAKTRIPLIVCPGRSDPNWLGGQLEAADWIVDALLGTGATGDPRPPLDQVIDQLNLADARRLALDLPSGLDCDTGIPSAHTFRADHTCTFVAAKSGFANQAAKPFLGRVHVVDIGVPRELIG